jgi:ring-1,2-phenylacetyl-CoA epoxidase subunit PaaD
METLTAGRIWQILEEVKDPEIPVVSVVEMGMIRSVGLEGQKITIRMTPTFAGCPALKVIQAGIAERLRQSGAGEVEVKVTLSPPWSSDWITSDGRRKLKEFGLAPPPLHQGQIDSALDRPAICPYCDSQDTVLKNSFGPTLCRAIYVCNQCHQPFEQFKPI